MKATESSAFPPIEAGALLAAVTLFSIGIGTLIGWLAGSIAIGLIIGAVIGIPAGIVCVYIRYRSYFS